MFVIFVVWDSGSEGYYVRGESFSTSQDLRNAAKYPTLTTAQAKAEFLMREYSCCEYAEAVEIDDDIF